jgi:hypothetical protein
LGSPPLFPVAPIQYFVLCFKNSAYGIANEFMKTSALELLKKKSCLIAEKRHVEVHTQGSGADW